MAALARESGVSKVFVPRPDGQEAALVEGIEAFPVGNLVDLILHLGGERELTPISWDGTSGESSAADGAFDISTIRGQEQSKRALEVAAAGQPQLADERAAGFGQDAAGADAADDTAVANARRGDRGNQDILGGGFADAGESSDYGAAFQVSAPHYLIRRACRGRKQAAPGRDNDEPSGVLFLDELPEFGHRILEAMRQLWRTSGL